MLLIYGLFCFTQFVTEPETRNFNGYAYIAVVACNVFVHLTFLLLDTFRKVKRLLKRFI